MDASGGIGFFVWIAAFEFASLGVLGLMGLVSRGWPLWLGAAALLGAVSLPAWGVEATLVADAHVNQALPAVNSGAISNLNVGGGYMVRQGTPGAMADTGLGCSAASGGSCTATGSVAVGAGNFVDLSISGASGTAAGVWTALACN